MQFDVAPEHKGNFEPFKEFLKTDLPKFVKDNPSIERMLCEEGLYSNVHAVQAAAIPNAKKRKQILNNALTWDQLPLVFPMAKRFFGGRDNSSAVGAFDGSRIMIHRPLVEAWQERDQRWPKKPEYRLMVHRWIIQVMLHELVHFFQHQVFPDQLGKLKDDHFDSFEKKIYGKLKWEEREYAPAAEWFDVLGIAW